MNTENVNSTGSALDYFNHAKRKFFMNFFRNYFYALYFFALKIVIAFTVILSPLLTPFQWQFYKKMSNNEKHVFHDSFNEINLSVFYYFKIAFTLLVVYVIVTSGFLLLIPGFIFFFALAPVPYLLAFYPETKTSALIKASMFVMKGHRLKLFVLQFVPIIIVLFLYYLTASLFTAIISSSSSGFIYYFFIVLLSLATTAFILLFPMLFIIIKLASYRLFEDLFSPHKSVINKNLIFDYEKPLSLDYVRLFMLDVKSLSQLYIPQHVRHIHFGEFSDCDNLREIHIGNDSSLERVGPYAFENCTSLTKIILPENLAFIGSHAFKGCHALKEVTITSIKNDSIIELEENVFTDVHKAFKIMISPELYEHYANSKSWSAYKDKMKKISVDKTTDEKSNT